MTAIDALLPQTQCTRCGYAGCRPYAEAIAAGDADINQCPPGGSVTIHALAKLLGRPFKPLNPVNGSAGPLLIAVIDEARCIGCARCLPACPVDAIIGAQRFMHTVIEAACTGCELCIPPCPVDCISMQPAVDALGRPAPIASTLEELQAAAATHRRRYDAHSARSDRLQAERAALLDSKKRLAEGWRGAGRTS